MHMGNCQIATVLRHIVAHHFEEIPEALRYMNRNELFTHVEPGVWKKFFLRTFQFEILSVYFLILFDRLLRAVWWISLLRHTGLLCQGLGVICLMTFPMLPSCLFHREQLQSAMNVIAMSISRMNALILFVLLVIIKATLVRNIRTLQEVVVVNPWFILALTLSIHGVLPFSILL